MPAAKLDRLQTGIGWLDNWIDSIVSAIERALTVTATPPLSAKVGPTGVHLSFSTPIFALAKSGGSGIGALSGSTPGVADVTLWDFNGTTIATQTVTTKAYNLSATAVGNNKLLILAMIGRWWFVMWEDCG